MIVIKCLKVESMTDSSYSSRSSSSSSIWSNSDFNNDKTELFISLNVAKLEEAPKPQGKDIDGKPDGRPWWMLSPDDKDKEEKEKETAKDKEKKEREKKERERTKKPKADGAKAPPPEKSPEPEAAEGKAEAAKAEPAKPDMNLSGLNEEELEKRLFLAMEQRGHKGVELLDVAAALRTLLSCTNPFPALHAQILGNIVSIKLECVADKASHKALTPAAQAEAGLNKRGSSDILLWRAAMADLTDLTTFFLDHPDQIVLHEYDTENEAELNPAAQAGAGMDAAPGAEGAAPPKRSNPAGAREVRLSIVSLLNRLERTQMVGFSTSTLHSSHYVERLGNEHGLLKLMSLVQTLYLSLGASPIDARIALMRLLHVYYKLPPRGTAPPASLAEDDQTILVRKLYAAVVEHCQGDREMLMTATLCLCSHLALIDASDEAKALLRASNLYDNVPRLAQQVASAIAGGEDAEFGVQVLFNRTLVQIGFAAFRKGLVAEALNYLQEIAMSQHVGEMLGQSLQKANQRQYHQRLLSSTQARELQQSKLQGQVPPHIRIDEDLIEAVFLVCSLIRDTTELARQGRTLEDATTETQNSFPSLARAQQSSILATRLESAKDYIYAAAQNLFDCEWRKTQDNVLGLKCWKAFEKTYPGTTALIKSLIRETGLLVLLLQARKYYDSLSIDYLCLFLGTDPETAPKEEVEEVSRKVRSLIVRLLYAGELEGTFEIACGQLSSKLSRASEATERLAEAKYATRTRPGRQSLQSGGYERRERVAQKSKA